MEGEEANREVSPPILNREEKEQPDNLHGVNRELGNPPDFWYPKGLAREEGASQRYESSSEESEEEENNLVGRDMDESMEEEPFPEQEGALVEGRSQDDENGAVQEDNIGSSSGAQAVKWGNV